MVTLSARLSVLCAHAAHAEVLPGRRVDIDALPRRPTRRLRSSGDSHRPRLLFPSHIRLLPHLFETPGVVASECNACFGLLVKFCFYGIEVK